MIPAEWKLRVKLFFQRFWQPTSACMTVMPGSLTALWNSVHWSLALQTGLMTGVLAVLLSYTPVRRLYRNRYGNAAVVGCLTALADAWSHPSNFLSGYAEPVVTGLVSALLALAGSVLFEDRARRLRAVWSRLAGTQR